MIQSATTITRSPAQGSACKDAYTPTSNRAGSLSPHKKPARQSIAA
ncbi:Hypothetical protein LOCK908_2503 [Lacticaseibacillus rhamnosus LOCK908]|uniref:ATP-dependent nuclease subunit B n=1 Tax=Lacticaseibacillus rhamnosus LRHMDP3 TaxID=1203259 RepID=A0AB33XS72_LACRH|nr:Hypothetical protein LOCK908_2503 [Lacticaseibacillus rhamnosus LOCK908]EKS49376.1 hypothetical protein LRHMDP3_2394 [Lacticaseibacillus rhamnosus LRHMDP3]EKS50249.1 hypothetical protein LRHMDP2_2102 [Lacticaseibacillus rhamnosus LRHMDP2]CAR91273.1 Putative protein without homology [Lacticaseibacillus rhamnosus Lc 705]